jgi:hypothetical protein
MGGLKWCWKVRASLPMPACAAPRSYCLDPVFGPARSQQTGDFHEGIAAVRLNGLWVFADRNLSVLVKPQFRVARDFSEGLVFSDGRLAYIDRKGRAVFRWKR